MGRLFHSSGTNGVESLSSDNNIEFFNGTNGKLNAVPFSGAYFWINLSCKSYSYKSMICKRGLSNI